MPRQLISDVVRTAMRRDPRSQNKLAADSGVDGSVLSRFANSERSLTLNSADKICRALRLRLVQDSNEGPRPPKKARR